MPSPRRQRPLKAALRETPHQAAYIEVVRTHEALNAGFSKLFRQYRLSQPLFNVLRILYVRDVDGRGLPTMAIAQRLINHVPDTTRLVDRLVERGLVKRLPSEADRRLVLVRLTPAGRLLVEKIHTPILRLHHEQLSHLSSKELSDLARLLARARQSPA